ncbi:MAG: ATP-binding cassette domain-containing protein [Lachnospiraceae bacterium]|nr:ATP-binding cassette domain-containing protein [Lachnospiraceae bacterium]
MDRKRERKTVNRNSPAGLVFFEEKEKPRQYIIFHNVKIGKGEEEVIAPHKLVLNYPFLDEDQCEISNRDGHWVYKNTSSSVFTFVGGLHVKEGEERILENGDMIRLSNDRMLTAIFLTDVEGMDEWETIDLDTGDHTVRIVDGDDLDKPVEDQDAILLHYDQGRWEISEIQSDDIRLNGQKINRPTRIRIDDCIGVGDTLFYFEGAKLIYGNKRHRLGALSIQIDERAVYKHFQKQLLLQDINLSVERGNMVLILGGSGAGKSTFVNAVTGYEKAKATIKSGEIDFYKQYDEVKYQIGFVPQKDLLRGEDSVYNTLLNAAEIRLPSDIPFREREKRVREVMETFGLTPLKDEFVSKLSGGQRKRLSIGVEYISSPSLFILDEPDSGLDGIMARELMENLKLIAWQDKIVMVISHTPDRVINLFDKVIVLAKNTEHRVGQLAFYGNIEEARRFFNVDSMEEIVKEINSVSEGGEGRADYYIEKYKAYSAERDRDQTPGQAVQEKAGAEESPEDEAAAELETALSTEDRDKAGERTAGSEKKYAGRLGQIKVYFWKQVRIFRNEKNWKVFPMAALIAFLVSYVLGYRMFRNMEGTRLGGMGIISICIWNGFFNSIQTICKEREIIKREHRSGLHISSYVMAQMLLQAIVCLLQVLISIFVFYIYGVYFPDTGIMTGFFVLDLCITMFLVTYAADMLALMVSCIVKNTTSAMTVMPFLLLVQLVFTGVLFPLQGFSEKISDLTIGKWGVNATCVISDYNSQPSVVLYTALSKLRGNPDVDAFVSMFLQGNTRQAMDKFAGQNMQEPQFEYSAANVGRDWIILCGDSLLYAFLGILALERVDKDQR